MQFYTSIDVPHSSQETVFKISPVVTTFVYGLFAIFALGLWGLGLWGGYNDHNVHFPRFICYFMAGGITLFLLLFMPMVLGVFSQDNWLMIFQPERILLKYRSYLNRHFNKQDMQICSIQPAEIERVRKYQEWQVTGWGRNQTQQLVECLEIKLRSGHTQELEQLLEAEVARKAPKIGLSATKYYDYPVTVPEAGVIRVNWAGIRPRLDQCLALLSRFVTVGEPHRADNVIKTVFRQITTRPPNPDDEVKIRALAMQGKKIEAIALAREVYGIGLKDAKERVEGMVLGK